MIHIARDNGNTINDSNNTAFDKPSFFVTSFLLLDLLLDSDTLENTFDHIHKVGSGIYLGFVICSTWKEPIAVMAGV